MNFYLLYMVAQVTYSNIFQKIHSPALFWEFSEGDLSNKNNLEIGTLPVYTGNWCNFVIFNRTPCILLQFWIMPPNIKVTLFKFNLNRFLSGQIVRNLIITSFQFMEGWTNCIFVLNLSLSNAFCISNLEVWLSL